MNKQELTSLVAEILSQMNDPQPQVKASEYKTVVYNDDRPADSGSVDDISKIDLRKQYLVEDAADEKAFRRLKERTPARLGSGRAGPRYKTVTMLRFRADHAAAQDAVFSELPEDFGEKNGLISVKTQCKDKDEYLTRPDKGRRFDAENGAKIKAAISTTPRVQLVIGDGLSSAAIAANAMDCAQAIRDGLKVRGIELGQGIYVKYCRVGAGDAVGDLTGCELVCVLVGERPGLVTDKSMSAYITYKPHTGVSESSRTVVSNIHAQGTPAVEAGAYVAELIEKILQKKVSGVGLLTEDKV